ncbi:MAG: hypothetical protein H7Z38_03780 [Rubrivivax sp.]|nr:hypothetical protein [Pyrinomonadaceae bacterium]
MSSAHVFLYAAAANSIVWNISVPQPTPENLLDRLDELKRPAGAHGRALLRSALVEAARREFDTASSLIRFHEILLFLRAYPQSKALLRQTEKILSSFKRRVDKLRDAEAEDFYEFADPEVSGIAGTYLSAVFSYDITRWLAAHAPSRLRLDWEDYEETAQLAAVLPLLLPLLEEEVYVENHFPQEALLRAARSDGETELAWLLRGFERLKVPDRERVALFESLKLAVRWELGNSAATRTRMRRPVRKIFYHDAPMLARRDVFIARELEDEPMPVEKLTLAEGRKLLDAGRATMTVRYRELHGFTYGDPRTVRRADAGRGVELYLWGVPANRRLPTLAYHAVLMFKNGIPCGYAEALTLFERIETGLNLFYTFRDGESAWVFARVLRLFRQLLGATVFSVEPYQLGSRNEEGIESGAFWFYRKLGFRPVVPHLAKLAAREDRRIATRPGYRTGARTLRTLAEGHALYEASPKTPGEWDGFHIRNLTLAIARRMARQHGGDSMRARRESVETVSGALGIRAARWNDDERRALENFSLLLALVPDLSSWTKDEKDALVRLIRAKAGTDEVGYLRLLQKHEKLRREIIRLGSKKQKAESRRQ